MRRTKMFIDNDSTHQYYEIIKSAKLSCRRRSDVANYHNHHILPKSLGGTDDCENLVLLTVLEHYAVHRLLTKMLVGIEKSKMVFALMRFGVQHLASDHEKHIALNEIADSFRGTGNPFYGRKHTEKTKRLISKNHGMRGRGCYDVWLEKYGKEKADELQIVMLARRSASLMGEKNGMFGTTRTNEQKQRQSDLMTGENNPNFGKTFKWVCKNGVNKQIQNMLFDEYLKKGWKPGRTQFAKARKWMKKDGANKLVPIDDVESNIRVGWVMGRNSMPNRSKRAKREPI
jgi:hypothetical protein